MSLDTRADPIAELLAGSDIGSPLVAERCHHVLRARDARFDGRFFVGVRTTGIFCRPICPAPTPKPANCTYWRSAAAALPMTEVALAAGASRTIELVLPYRPPYAWHELIGFLRDRAIPGVESIEQGCYVRSFRAGEKVGSLAVRVDNEKCVIRANVRMSSIESLVEVNGRLRRLFDVDADAAVIDAVVRRVPSLRSQIARVPGMRVPGAFDGFETAVRAILGQQISVKGATTFAGRIADKWGKRLARELAVTDSLQLLFPEPSDLVDASLETIGLTRTRADTIRGLARAVLEDPDLTRPGAGLEIAAARWESLAGIGPWTAQYVAMRVLREPDALPIGDLGLRKAITKSGEKPRHEREVEKTLEVCRPYRAYAAIRLWESLRSAR